MKRPLLIAGSVLLLLAVAFLAGGDRTFWRHYFLALTGAPPDRVAAAIAPRLPLAGDPAAPPLASAESEAIAPEALVQAAARATQIKARALIVQRHGHRVLQTFDETTTGATELTGGELAPAVYALALAPLVDTRRLGIDAAIEAVRQESALFGAPGWRNPWSADARRHFRLRPPPELLLRDADGGIAGVIAQRVWQPLQARAGALWGSADALRVDCCIVAALDDWVRVGEVLLQSGTYEGQRLASPDWIRALLAADLQQQRHPVWLREQRPWTGAEPPAARDTFWFDLGRGVRLWLVPRRALSVLVWAPDDERARDTELPNILIRGMLDQAPAIGSSSDLNQIVPGH
jgi:hypothetical protein